MKTELAIEIPRTVRELAQEAILVQDACNPLGLSKSFAKAVEELRDRLVLNGRSGDTRAICNHPITRLWVSKLHDLSNMGVSDVDRFAEAYRACLEMAGTTLIGH